MGPETKGAGAEKGLGGISAIGLRGGNERAHRTKNPTGARGLNGQFCSARGGPKGPRGWGAGKNPHGGFLDPGGDVEKLPFRGGRAAAGSGETGGGPVGIRQCRTKGRENGKKGDVVGNLTVDLG